MPQLSFEDGVEIDVTATIQLITTPRKVVLGMFPSLETMLDNQCDSRKGLIRMNDEMILVLVFVYILPVSLLFSQTP